MRVSHIFRQEPITVYDSSTVKEALERMSKEGTNGLIVVGKQSNTVVGVLCIQDIAAAIVPTEMQENANLAEALNKDGFFEETVRKIADSKVSAIMRTDFTAANSDTPIMEIAADFLQNDLYIVPVIENEKLIGVVSRTEIKRALQNALQQQ